MDDVKDSDLINTIRASSDEALLDVIPKALFNFSDEKISMVSFVFWFAYLAETKLDEVIKLAWDAAQKDVPIDEDTKQLVKKYINSFVMGKEIDPEKPEYFIDKIKLTQVFFPGSSLVSIYYKINEIRNDLSHGRIDSLKYNNESLSLRKTREKLLIDYLTEMSSLDNSKVRKWSGNPDFR
jgi:hypothetical protein